MPLLAYSIILIAVFAIAVLSAFFWVYNLYAQLSGSAYVPIAKSEIDPILSKLALKKGQTLIELGSGDGRFLRRAVKKYKVSGTGIDINPLLTGYSRLLVRLDGVDANFVCNNIFSVDMSDADVIFLFMMPSVLLKLKPKLKKETKKGVIIASHGFYFEGWNKYMTGKLDHKPFPTFFYMLK